jgi:hypothetical protein
MGDDMPITYKACECQIWPVSAIEAASYGDGYCGYCDKKVDKPSTREDFELQEDLRDEGVWCRGAIVGEGDYAWR